MQRVVRGYTLLELMLVVGMASILGTTFCSAMYFQVLTFMARLDEVDAHESARAAFEVMRFYIQGARYGLTQNINAVGVAGIGQCFADGGSGTQLACHGPDNGADRLRIVNIKPDQNFVGSSPYPSSGPCNGAGTPVDASRINVAQQPNYSFSGTSLPALMAIGGNCGDGNVVAGNDVVVFNGDSGSANGCTNRYSYGFIDSATALSCSSGYMAGFGFGAANVSDFYLYPDTINPNTRNLLMRTDPRLPLSSGMVVAYNVSKFTIYYRLDTNTPPNRRAEVGCWDMRNQADGGPCITYDSQNQRLTTQQNLNRVVAATLTMTVNSSNYRPAVFGPSGYRSWTYTTYISLRNNGL